MKADSPRKRNTQEKTAVTESGCDARRLFKEINLLHREDFLRLGNRDICVFLPHCLRSGDCSAPTTKEGIQCRRCGDCSVGSIFEAADEHGIRVFCVSGGSTLKPLIKKYEPQGLAGVACEKELLLALDMLSDREYLYQLFLLEKDGCFETKLDSAPLLDLFRELSVNEEKTREARENALRESL